MEGYEKIEPLRTDGMKRAKGAQPKTKANPKGGGKPIDQNKVDAVMAGESGVQEQQVHGGEEAHGCHIGGR